MKGLEPVRAHYIEGERARAQATVAAAHETARQLLAQAAADAAEATANAQHEGHASADLDTTRDWTTARRRARDVVLAAQRDVYEKLRETCAAAIRSDPRYPALQRHVADDARKRLGPGAEVTVQSDVVIVTRKHRRIRWSLAGAVDESLRAVVEQVRELWQ